MGIDFGKTAKDYGRHRAGFPEAFFARLATCGIGGQGQRVLDLGTGTGTLARGLALRGCRVTGLDKSDALLSEAERLDAEAGIDVEYVLASAEDTGQPSAAFDVVTAGQCWHWFDRPRVALEARRVLGPRGRLAIAHFDWLPLPGNIVEFTEGLIGAYNPAWNMSGGSGLYPEWLKDVAVAGFIEIETFSFDVHVRYSHEGWRGRIRASAGVGASLAPDAMEFFDAELGSQMSQRFSEDPVAVPHRVWTLVCCAP